MVLAAAHSSLLGEPTGQGWRQIIELSLAFALSSMIGLERELRHKSAGLRTHALVGVGAALFMLVSKYGFTDVLQPGKVVLDPSRVAAQIVSGIGFIGAGLIFVRRDAVRGLTTAAVIWVTAAVGAACGAGLPVLALFVTGLHFVIVLGLQPVVRRLPRSRYAQSTVRVTYRDGGGHLRSILSHVTDQGFVVADLATAPVPSPSGGVGERLADGGDGRGSSERMAEVTLLVQGAGSIGRLTGELMDLDGVNTAIGVDTNDIKD